MSFRKPCQIAILQTHSAFYPHRSTLIRLGKLKVNEKPSDSPDFTYSQGT